MTGAMRRVGRGRRVFVWLGVVLAMGIAAAGCGTPSDVRNKIALEASIHEGYERLIQQGASREDCVRMLRASGAAWYSLDRAVNHDGEPAFVGSATADAVTSRGG